MKSSLNLEQQKAVRHYRGPLLIIAGPGTGKTTVLTHRLAYLVEKKKISPSQILAVTFTNKAAQEMEERIDQLLPSIGLDLNINTFHSLGEEILRENGLAIGLPINFKVLDEKGSWLMIRQFWDRFKVPYYQPLGDPGQLISALVTHFSRCKDEGVSPEDYQRYLLKIKQQGKDADEIKQVKSLVQAYQTYQQLLLENNCLDFGDLISYSRLLFKKRPKILKAYRQRWSFILIDEFQDTNWTQYQLMKLLAEPQKNFTVCASGDQAIYQWRGASFNNILQFTQDYPQAKVVILKKNYRSRQEILDLSYDFIQFNNPNRLEYQVNQKRHQWRVDNHLTAVKKGKATIQFLHFSSWLKEVTGVANQIQLLLKKVSPNEIAVLARTHQTLQPFYEALKQRGVNCQVFSASDLYRQSLVLDFLAYFQILNNRFDDSSFYRVLNLPFWKIKSSTIARLIQYRQKRGQSLYQSLGEIVSQLDILEKKKVTSFLTSLEKYAEMIREKKVSEVLVKILEETGWLKWLVSQKTEQDLALLDNFYHHLQEFEQNSVSGRLNDFLRQVAMEREAGGLDDQPSASEEGPEAVKVMTVHAAKGLEFEYVFLVGLVNQKFPSSRRGEAIPLPQALIREKIPAGDLHLQEERRLFYVAMTRAKKGLFFTWADDYGGVRKRAPSRFLRELKVNLGQPISTTEEPSPKKKQLTKKYNQSLRPKHSSFTQLKNFWTCPQQYKFTHLLRLPTQGGPSRSFGKTIHKTLEIFLKSYSQQSKFQADWPQLLKIYQENWIDDWYETKEQRASFFKNGKKQLRVFFRDFRKHPPQIYIRSNQVFLEEDFTLKLGKDFFQGKIDRIDVLGDGVEIIDYKTGKPLKRLNGESKKQLLIYQIAAEEVFHLQPKKLSFYYLQDGSRLSFLGREEDKQRIKKEIKATIQEIKNSSFPAKPGFHCRYCDYRHICEYYHR